MCNVYIGAGLQPAPCVVLATTPELEIRTPVCTDIATLDAFSHGDRVLYVLTVLIVSEYAII
jgi:hypothetical protein